MKVTKLWFDNEKIFILTDTGKELWQSLLWYPRLLNASNEQRMDYELWEYGIRWDKLDEDMSYESFLHEDPEPTGIALIFRKHPELNVSAVARKIGIRQSLLAAYISGTKKPSPKRTKEIIDVIHVIGKELVSI